MKKKIFILTILLSCLMFFSFANIVHANEISSTLDCEAEVTNTDGTITKTCTIKYEVDGKVSFNKAIYTLTLTNMKIKSYDFNDDWYIEEINDSKIVLNTTQTELTGSGVIGTVVFQKIVNSDPCKIEYDCEYEKVVRKCEIYQGVYYDDKGQITTELNYKKLCEKPKCTKYSDGTYSDNLGNIVSYLEYTKVCEKHTCEKLSDGTYFGKNNTIVDEETYKEECEVKHICEKVDDKYYNGSGKEVTKLEFTKECEKHICEQLEDGTYFDKEGNIVTEEAYNASCIENPETGNINIILFLTSGIGIAIITGYLVNKHNKFRRI